MMTNGQETRRSWARLAPSGTALVLFCSLFLNVVLGSYIAVQALVAQPQRPPQRGPQQMVARLAERLPPSDAAILREAYLAREAEILAAEMAAQRARARLTEILGRPELDLEALRAASKEMRAQRNRISELISETLDETMQRIAPEARQKLVSEEFRRR
jgi:Spy/CpxP family protein refolding chaperone